MSISTLRKLYKRDLNRLKSEVGAYTDEKNLWITSDGISNCGGNLCLHLIGNLNAFIGAELGNSGYVRQRELEFSKKNVPKAALISEIESTILVVDSTLEKLSEEDLSNEYPIVVFKESMSIGYFLMHLATHLTYHLGQVNYHRRLLDR
ncbi:DinB family protein [Maribacter algarum]|uniref:DinB family protein n=1 Tax=Maribacter algarum (ex Zhang et al. 2020) TaxID=2578118 RepID=A0A5S3PWS3_9FLAO|nr:DinB family protein [Maribacter algarum]TMM59469.1 DinB family protein [Maribacter algarum]